MGVFSIPNSDQTDIDHLPPIAIPKFKIKPKISPFVRRRHINTQNLLQQNKLILLLDLDHTLVNAVTSMELSSSVEYIFYTPDVKISIWEDYIIKLRPFVHTFLHEASELFDLHICTMGTRQYALKIAELLDPEGIYFSSSKIISREDFREGDQKDLGLVVGEERIVVILDDRMDVWKGWKDNLIVIGRYDYFAESSNESKCSLCERKEDEDEFDGALWTALNVLKRIHSMFFEAKFSKDVRLVMKMIGDEVENGGCGVDDQRWVVDIK